MKILLTSVFGPYGVDDEYGRKENVMELFHNQVTREQGLFSLRNHHPSSGLHLMAENISVPTVVLDFPSKARFIRELKNGYDYVGISFIAPNFVKAREMARLIRHHSPSTRIILGGHGTRIDNIKDLIPCDHICRGEGVRFLRELLGEDVDQPIRHPIMKAAFGRRILGIPLPTNTGLLMPGVGCVNGCRFCCTTHFFEKTYTPFLQTGREIFELCCRMEEEQGSKEFFIMDENFLKQPDRARDLLALMETHKKTWRFGIFSSAETINQVGIDFLKRLGLYFLWLGVESKFEIYEKNQGLDIHKLIQDIRDSGVSVLASGILFLEQHDRQTIEEDIDFMVSLNADFVQFMQLGPLPGTRLYHDYKAKNLLRFDIPYEEWHGQHRLWFDHAEFSHEESENILRRAFRKDYDVNASSLLRICDTALRGYRALVHETDPYLRLRLESTRTWLKQLRVLLEALKVFAHNTHAQEMARRLDAEYQEVLGPMPRSQKALAKVATAFAAKEMLRVGAGLAVYQPETRLTGYRLPPTALERVMAHGEQLTDLMASPLREVAAGSGAIFRKLTMATAGSSDH